MLIINVHEQTENYITEENCSQKQIKHHTHMSHN